MRPSIRSKNVISKWLHHLYKRLIVLDGYFNHGIFDLALNIKHTVRNYIFTNIKVLYITLDTTFKIKCGSFFRTLVTNGYIYPLCKIGLVTQVVNHPLVIKLNGFLKNSRIWIKCNGRSVF